LIIILLDWTDGMEWQGKLQRALKKGKVYIVGAGPGDPKLITVYGLECIQNSDVIVYDRLVNKELLNYAKQDAELIYCGKLPGKHHLIQEQINELLVNKALDGNIVTRLKERR
jgi:uroporphyrin-III C-methyltransferase